MRARSHRIAMATYERAPNLTADDRLLIPALESHGISAQPAVWSDATVDWASFDAIVIRSCWDYHLRVAEFHAWLDRLDALERVVCNPTSIVRWNADKRYLGDLDRRGVATITTVVVPRGGAGDAASEIEAAVTTAGWSRIVIKPAISASGHETYALRVPFDDDARATIRRVVSLGDLLVQPFVDEIARDGELSIMLIDGAFSHATRKRAAAGEFRVQAEHGGSAEPTVVSEALVAQAGRALAGLPEPPVYARVDGIERNGAFLLMELELIEPNLFLGHSPGAADRLATAIARRMKPRSGI